MTLLVKLFITFFKIGLFGFGGGYAMIPLISDEITRNQWLTESEFIQIIGIAEMTPGPIAVNSATFVGYRLNGIPGSLVATLGVTMPSLLILIFISTFFFKYYKHPLVDRIFWGIRPVIAGLVFSAVLILARTTFLVGGAWPASGWPMLEPATLVSFVVILGLAYGFKKKIHPILYIVIAGVIGFASYFVVG